VCSHEGRGTQGCEHKGVLKPQEENMGTSLYINNSLFTYYVIFISSLLSHFVEKKYFHGNMGTYKIGGAPPA
jgi:hypothetical protein